MSVLKLYRSGPWAIVPVHYSHDPAKTLEWALDEREKYRLAGKSEVDWDREMELDFGAQLGAACYSSFRKAIHVVDDLPLFRNLPLALNWDFNVDPMSLTISQIVAGIESVIDEIAAVPGTVGVAVKEFRNRYPDHPAELHIYGDASGNERGQTGRTNYDLMKLEFAGYPSPVVFFVPLTNPPVKSRVNAVNRILVGANSKPGAVISRRCMNLIQDLEEVVWTPDGKTILKIHDPKKPYSKRTHFSDGWGYKVARLWPVVDEVIRAETKKAGPRPPMNRSFGAI